MLGSKLLLLPIAVLIGTLLALQPAVNGDIARRLGSPFAAVLVSLVVSFLIVLPFALYHGRGIQLSSLPLLPWWVILGGLAGAAFVTGGIMIVPITGLATFLAAVLFGQAIGALVIDHFGLLNLAETPVSYSRVVGLALVFGGFQLLLRNPF